MTVSPINGQARYCEWLPPGAAFVSERPLSSAVPEVFPEVFRVSRQGLGGVSRRRDDHFADVPSTSLLKHLLKVEGDAAE